MLVKSRALGGALSEALVCDTVGQLLLPASFPPLAAARDLILYGSCSEAAGGVVVGPSHAWRGNRSDALRSCEQAKESWRSYFLQSFLVQFVCSD